MANKNTLVDWVEEALKHYNKSATIVDVCKYIWNNYQQQLKSSGDLFYTWQYDVRWAATELRKNGTMKSTQISKRGRWELV